MRFSKISAEKQIDSSDDGSVLQLATTYPLISRETADWICLGLNPPQQTLDSHNLQKSMFDFEMLSSADFLGNPPKSKGWKQILRSWLLIFNL